MRPRVDTSGGPVVGVTEDGICVFRGIPYGSDTGGEARFLPPRSPVPWTEPRDCAAFGPSCPPTLTPADRAFFPMSPLWSVYAGIDPLVPFSEDCLRLNVWTASCESAARRPVIVWLHGGGFSWGSGSSPLTVGDELARHHDMVIVTVNHRLGVLGYLHPSNDEKGWADSGVAGLLDLQLALEWVRDNIETFGGDPGNVTIAGHSGGSAKVACLLALPSAEGLFRRAIIMSGVVTLRSMTAAEASSSTRGLLAAAKVDDVGKLRGIPVERLTALAGDFRFRPVVGEPSLPRHPFDPDAAPGASGIELLTGVAKDDAATFKFDSDPTFATLGEGELVERVLRLPGIGDAEEAARVVDQFRRRYPSVSPAHLLVEITTMGLRERTAVMVERKLRADDAAVWVYEFDYDVPMPPDTAFPGEMMSPHGAELPFVFDLGEREWLAGSDPGRMEFAHTVSRYWTNFARTGNPNGAGLPSWPRYSLAEKRVIHLLGT